MKFTLLAFAVCLFAHTVYGNEEEWQCKPGIRYKENECNNCFCTETHVMGCTDMACESQQRLGNCTVGTTYQKDCNECTCVKDMGMVCENEEC